jgi:raffinose/stachyose/melibiose transport system permease protein
VPEARLLAKKRQFDTDYWGFLAPALILYILFVIVPAVSSVYYSFTSWDGISSDIRFIGLANFNEIFTSARFGNALKNTVVLTLFISLLENFIALALALLLDKLIYAKGVFRSLFYIPVLVSGIVSGFIWKVMYNYNFGIINTLFRSLDLEHWCQDWLGDPAYTLVSIGIVLVWKGAGYYMVIYLASLQNIPRDIIEAAEIDGANARQRFRNITIPLISSAFTINFTLSLIRGLKVFDQINVMTDGGPGFTSETMVYLLYKVGFNEGRQGFGTAVGLMLLFLILILNGAQQKFLQSREVQL